MNERLAIRAERAIWEDTVRVYMGHKQSDGAMAVFNPPTITRMEPGSFIAEPFLRMTPTEAQRLMDELWGCGLRPSEGSGSAGSLAATERHLKDMQTIAMSLLDVNGARPSEPEQRIQVFRGGDER